MKYEPFLVVPSEDKLLPALSGRAALADQSGSRQSCPRMTVIVVDDEIVIAESLADILAGVGCDAVALASGQAAVDWARKVNPDLVITDVAMPGMNGIETARNIREFLPMCRILLFSGQGATTDLLADSRAPGEFFEMLIKPVKPAVLLSLLGLPNGQ